MEERERCYSFILSRTPHETSKDPTSDINFSDFILFDGWLVQWPEVQTMKLEAPVQIPVVVGFVMKNCTCSRVMAVYVSYYQYNLFMYDLCLSVI
jgi:hypothetical protein